MGTMDLRDGLRLLRSAPAYHIETVAAFAGVAAGSLRSAMHQLRTRGRCAALLVDAADRGKIRDRVAVLSLRACPPGMVRAASHDHHESGRSVASAPPDGPNGRWARTQLDGCWRSLPAAKTSCCAARQRRTPQGCCCVALAATQRPTSVP